MTIRSLLLRSGMSAAGFMIVSCASPPPPSGNPGRADLPQEATFDRGIGTNRVLCVRLRGEHGESWRFLVDSGSPITIFDSSLRAKLGPVVGTEPVQYAWSGAAVIQAHNAPRLFLNGTPLITGSRVWSDDLRKVWPGRGIDGILGLDCLRRYCVQLDFPHHTVRFLDPERAVGPQMGRAFPLYLLVNSAFVEGDLMGAGATLYQVDTGCSVDAVMRPPLFRRACQREQPDWMREFTSAEGVPVIEAGFGRGSFAGNTYGKMIVDSANHSFLGLRFLSRHVVTLNFPRQVMYLRRGDGD